MKTIKDLAILIQNQELSLAPKSESPLFQEFVFHYDLPQKLIEERGSDLIDDGEYIFWENQYKNITSKIKN
jgi:hypothetical protein